MRRDARFEDGPWSWKTTRQGFLLQLPGPTFVYVVPAPVPNTWTAYEATVPGLHVLAETQPLGTARGLGEMVALSTVLADKKRDAEGHK